LIIPFRREIDQSPVNQLLRYFIYGILWFLYTAIYAFLVFATLADGHGTFIFADTLISWILFAVALILIPWSGSKPIRTISAGALVGYLLASLALIVIEQTGEGNFESTVRFATDRTLTFSFTVAWLLLGQFLAWFLLYKASRLGPETLGY